jgi:PAS domain S-box-containing protein
MPRFSLASLRVRLLLLVLLAVIPALGLTFNTYAELRRLTAADVKREALRLARIAASDQEDTVKDTRQFLFALAQLPQMHGTDRAACSVFFARLLNQNPQYVLLGVIERDGELVCSAFPTSGPINLAHRGFFRRVLDTRSFAISDYQTDTLSGKATLEFGYPVLDEDGQVQVVVFAALDLTWLNELAAEAQLPAGSTFTVIDRNGTILVRYPEPEAWVGRTMDEVPIVEAILTQQAEGTAEAQGVDGTPRLFAFTPVAVAPAGEDVYVSIGIPTAVAYANANRVLTRNLLGLGLVTALALAAAWFGTDLFILRRVRRLVHTANRLSAGDLSVRTGLPHRAGELGQLAHAFDEMAASLERRVAERDRAEEALRESQRALSTLMTNLPGMAYRCRDDRGRTIEFVSEGCFELTGYTPLELMGNRETSFERFIHLGDREVVWNEVQAALQTQRSFQITYRIVTAAGQEKWAWEQGRGVFSAGGELLAVEGFVADATERVLAQQMLEQRVADRTRELSALYDVMAAATASLDLETVLARSLDRVLEAMHSEEGAIHLLDQTAEVMRLAVSQGMPPAVVTEIGTVPLDEALAGWNMEQGEPLVVSDIAEGVAPLRMIPVKVGDLTYAGAPMRVRGRVLGVLSVVRSKQRQFSAEEVKLLTSIADEVGVAVENARLYQQAEQLAVLRERERLARELHDSVTQSLYSLTLLAEAGGRLARADDLEKVKEYLARLAEIGQQALKEMRLLVYELRPLVLKREGLVGALRHRLEAVEKRAGVDARLLIEGELELPAPVEEAFYRIAQEALNNALKHAAPTLVTVFIRAAEDSVELEVVDDGKGFDPQAVSDTGGLGLVSMQERVERLGGTLTALSTPGGGTRVKACIPVGTSANSYSLFEVNR